MKNRLVSFTLIIFFILLSSCAKTEHSLSAAELLDLGEKYLLEMDYEQALVQFLKVIEVEPMNPRGYTGAAEAYVGLGEVDKAVTVLEQGFLQTEDDNILNMINALQADSPQENKPQEHTTDDDKTIIDSEAQVTPITPPVKEPIAQEISDTVDTILAELRNGNYEAAITEIHGEIMLSFLREQEDESYIYNNEMWDSSNNEKMTLNTFMFLYSEGDDRFPENVDFFIYDYVDKEDGDYSSYMGSIDSIIHIGGKTTVNYRFRTDENEIMYDLNKILGRN